MQKQKHFLPLSPNISSGPENIVPLLLTSSTSAVTFLVFWGCGAKLVSSGLGLGLELGFSLGESLSDEKSLLNLIQEQIEVEKDEMRGGLMQLQLRLEIGGGERRLGAL